eukprot:Clim_evm13s236 gene=Clim_evmTU13s236
MAGLVKYVTKSTRRWSKFLLGELHWVAHAAHAVLRAEEQILYRLSVVGLSLLVIIPFIPALLLLGILLSPLLFVFAFYLLLARMYDTPRYAHAPHRRIEGSCMPGWESVRDQFAVAIAIGNDLGASVSVYRKGEEVVDVAGGSRSADPDAEFYDAGTVNMLFSSTKFVESLVIAMLVDRGHLEYNKPIAHYWPEFGANGKELIEVQELMRHAAGLSTLDRMVELEELWPENSQDFGQYLASVKPTFKKRPGRKMPTAYHGWTRGLYVNQLVMRADPKGRDLRSFVLEEISGPLGVDFYVGLHPEMDKEVIARKADITMQPLSTLLFQILPQLVLPSKYYLPFINNPYHKLPRIIKQIVYGAMWFRSDTLFTRTVLGVLKTHPSAMNDKIWLRGLSPSANGYSNARGCARIAGCIANGGTIDGVTLISKEGLAKAMETDGRHLCKVCSYEFEFTRCGWAFFEEEASGCYGWGGYGGSLVLFHPELNLGFSYVMCATGTAAIGDHRGVSCLSEALLVADASQAVDDAASGSDAKLLRRQSVRRIRF